MPEPKVNRRGLFTGLFSQRGREAAGKVVKELAQGIGEELAEERVRLSSDPATGDDSVEEAPAAPPMLARIQPAACIAYRGSFCSVCVERCPEPGAISVDYGRPTVVVDHCTGCGECVERCPAPVVAITLHSIR